MNNVNASLQELYVPEKEDFQERVTKAKKDIKIIEEKWNEYREDWANSIGSKFRILEAETLKIIDSYGFKQHMDGCIVGNRRIGGSIYFLNPGLLLSIMYNYDYFSDSEVWQSLRSIKLEVL